MKTQEKCLKNLELVLQYVEAHDKRDQLSKEYSQKIKEARAKLDELSPLFSEDEISAEFMRVTKVMETKLSEWYQAQFNEKCKDYRADIASLTSSVKELKAKIAKYEKEIPELEKEWGKWDYVDKFCSRHLSEYAKEYVKDYASSAINPFEDELNADWSYEGIKYLKECIEKVPDEWITIRVGGKVVSKASFLKDYSPTYCRSESEINSKLLYITVDVPNTVKGLFFKKMNPLLVESIPGAGARYNELFVRWCAASWYRSLLKSDYTTLRNRISKRKNEFNNDRMNLQEGESVLKELQTDYDQFRSIGDPRKYIEAGLLKPVSQTELNQMKAQVIKTAASKLQILPDDLGDYIALSRIGEHYGNFLSAFSQDRAQIYIDKLKHRRNRVEQLNEECIKKVEAVKIPDLDTAFRRWSNEMPLYAQMGFPPKMTEQEVKDTMRKIIASSSSNYSLRIFPNGGCIRIPSAKGGSFTTENGEYVWAPTFSMPYGTANSIPNILTVYDKSSVEDAAALLNRTIVNILLTLPPRKVRLRIIDLAATNMASFVTTRLHPSLYNGEVVMNERELRSVVEEWQARTKRIMQKCENISDYNDSHQTWLEPYEIAVLLGYPQSVSPGVEELLKPFVQNGSKSGILFIVLNNVDVTPSHGHNLLEDRDLFKAVLPHLSTISYYPLQYTPIADHPQLLEAALNYLNEEAGKKEEKPVARQDTGKLVAGEYLPDTVSRIHVAVGDDNGRQVYFELDTVSHVHAFILGQSGTGKSRFLHNIIGNILLNHSPQNVELYMMDLKLGGVEFNVYRGEKHVRALLVDNNDRQITLEVLRELAARMKDRNKQFAELGVRNLEAYNQKAETPMPQLVLVVDECQMLFTERPDSTEREWRDILSLIAKQGRSQGVHMILSTQTLMNSAIPIDDLQGSGLTDFYLLNCDPRDSDKLVKNSSQITGTLQTGEIYYHHHQHAAPDVQFRSFYVDDAQQEVILQGVAQKSAGLAAVPHYYFSGKLQASLSEEVLASMQRRSRRALCASLGIGIDLKQQPLNVSLDEEQGENILLFGQNQSQQTTRTSVEIFLSALYSARAAGRDTEFIVIDCLSTDEDTPYQNLLECLEDSGVIRQVFGRQRGELLLQLGDAVRANKAEETVVLVLGQDRWREIRNDKALETVQETAQPPQGGSSSLLGGLSFGAGRQSQRTYRSELQYLLENGSEQGVHFILQVEKPQNLLGGQNLSQQFVKKLFRHWVMLRSASEAALSLRLRDDVRLENLSDDLDRLRAIYYSDDTDTYHLLTPYRYTTLEENKKLLSI